MRLGERIWFTLNPAYAGVLAEMGLDSFDRIVAYHDGNIFVQKAFSSVVFIPPLRPGDPSFYLKRAWRRTGLRAIPKAIGTLRWPRSVAAQEWLFTYRLRAAGVPTPEPIGVGERRFFGLERESFFMSLAVGGTETLRTFMRKMAADPGRGRLRKRALCTTLARTIRVLHDSGFIHGDLGIENLLIVEESPANLKMVMIDLTATRPIRLCPRRDVVRDWASMNESVPPAWASRADRLRVLKEYLRVTRLGQVEKGMIRRIVTQTHRLKRRLERREQRSRR